MCPINLTYIDDLIVQDKYMGTSVRSKWHNGIKYTQCYGCKHYINASALARHRDECDAVRNIRKAMRHASYYSTDPERLKQQFRNIIMNKPRYNIHERDLHQRWFLDELWVTEDKNTVPIERLSTPHLRNIVAYFKQNPDKLTRETPEYENLLGARLARVNSLLNKREYELKNKELEEALEKAEEFERRAQRFVEGSPVHDTHMEAAHTIRTLASKLKENVL